jgi:hypothetical protein
MVGGVGVRTVNKKIAPRRELKTKEMAPGREL